MTGNKTFSHAYIRSFVAYRNLAKVLLAIKVLLCNVISIAKSFVAYRKNTKHFKTLADIVRCYQSHQPWLKYDVRQILAELESSNT